MSIMVDVICDGPITKLFLEELLQEYFKTANKLSKAKGTVISKSLGFTADIVRVELQWEEMNVRLPKTVIVKAPKVETIASMMEVFTGETGDAVTDVSTKFIPLIHETECKAYHLLQRDKPLPIPIIYAIRPVTRTSPGVIVMEDMGQRAGLVENIANGLTCTQWRSAVECLADLHAWSLTTNQPWKEQISDSTAMNEFFKNFSSSTLDTIRERKLKYPEYFSDLDEDRIAKVISKIFPPVLFKVLVLQAMEDDNLQEKDSLYKKYFDDVMQHGDSWMNNIMYEKNHDGTLGDKVAAFIDWQMCLRGNGLNDFARLMTLSVNHEIRRRNYKQLLRVYYDRLKSRVGEKFNATYEQIEYVCNESAALNGLFCVFTIDFCLTNIVKPEEDKTGWRKKEMLTRAKAAYEDAATYYGWPRKVAN